MDYEILYNRLSRLEVALQVQLSSSIDRFDSIYTQH